MSEDVLTTLNALRAAGAPRFDAVGWHYIETLAERTQTQSGTAHALLANKLQQSLDSLHARMKAAAQATSTAKAPSASSPLAALLQELKAQDQSNALPAAGAWRAEHPASSSFVSS